MEKKYLAQFKAFLLANQVGNDPEGYIATLERISMLHPSNWDEKFPEPVQFKPDLNICRVIKSTKSKPIIPWWWYLDQKEPVPVVVEDMYKEIIFDYVLFFPRKGVWIYIIIEPEKKVLELLKNQDNLRAFIMMSIVNKNYKPNEREVHRVRLNRMLNSRESNKIFTFVAYSGDYKWAKDIPREIPTVSHLVDSTSTGWKIQFPDQKQVFWSFKELLRTLLGSPIHMKG